MRILVFSLLLYVPAGAVVAQKLGEEAARSAAAVFLNGKAGVMATLRSASVNGGAGKAATRSKSKAETLTRLTLPDNLSPYLFKNSAGMFVLVGGEDCNPQILGYGSCSQENGGTETLPELPPALLQRLKTYTLVQNQSNLVLAAAAEKCTPVEPLVKAVRVQEEPFNGSCPYYMYSDSTLSKNRCLVGCVATSLESILSYYKYPAALRDTLKGWRTAHYTVDTVMPETKIDFDNILDSYTEGSYTEEQAKAVADLSYWCGIAAHMNWNLSASGADLNALVEPLHRVFGYKYGRTRYASEYSARDWLANLHEELQKKRPVLFASYVSTLQGHAMVLDGLDENGLFHVLWGYGGHYDGFFNIKILNMFTQPTDTSEMSRVAGLCLNQQALFLSPDSVKCLESDTLVEAQRLRVDSVHFVRQPDLNQYVKAEVFVRNVSDADLFSTFVLSTFAPEDTAQTESGDEIGMAGQLLPANSSACLTAYCLFSRQGERVLVVDSDDSLKLFTDTIVVNYSQAPTMAYSVKDSTINATSVLYHFNYDNTSDSYWAGNDITYCLFRGDYDASQADERKFNYLNLAPRNSMVDSCSFNCLEPETKYTLVVRSLWRPVIQSAFTTSTATGIQSVKSPYLRKYYNLQGQPVPDNPGKGLYMQWIDGTFRKVYLK